MLEENEKQLNEIVDSLNDAVFLLSLEGHFIDANRTAYERLGYTREELLAMHITQLDPPEFAERVPERLGEIRSSEAAVFETAHLRKDGTAMPVEVNSRTIDYKGKKVYLSVIRDITERKQAQRDLEESEEKYQKLFNNEIDAICIFEVDTLNLIDVNDAFLKLYGYLREEALQLNVADVSAEAAKSKEAIHKSEASGDTLIPIRRHRKKDGTIIFVELSAGPFTWKGKRVMFSVIRDITARLEIEWALFDSERMYRSFVENLDGIAYRANAISWVPEFFHGRVEEITGYRARDFTAGKPRWDQIIHPDDFEHLTGKEELKSIPGYFCESEYRVIRKDGKVRWIAERSQSIPIDSGKIGYVQGIIIDITEKKLAQEKLRVSEEYVRSILDSVDEGFVVIDREYRIQAANRAYCEQVSLPGNEVLGRHCHEVSHRSERPCFETGEVCAVRETFATGKAHSAVHKHLDKEGQMVSVEVKAFPVQDPSGQVVSVIQTANDITERILLHEERLKTQKLESIGTLAGGIAHDFNNLLQGVFGHISMLRLSIDQKDKSLRMIERTEEALHRTVSLTNQLLTFSKGGAPVKKPFRILPVIESAVRFALSGSSSEYEILPRGGLWLADGDAGQIGQVIQNMTLNADQSMPQGGKIQVELRNIAADSEMPAILKGGDYVLISIRDNGLGIPEQLRDRIFDPYFTTKESGSGLGLATSYSIVRNHGGTIVVESRQGEGTTFSIYLPAVLEEIQAQEPEPAPARGRVAKVLVMDDEKVILEVTGNLLRALGHECACADNGEAAVAMFKAARAEGQPFDLVLLDLTIRGGMGGAETIRELLAIDPEVKAIVSSGYSNEAILSDYQGRGFKMFLKKPYSLKELQRAVNSLLE